MPQRYQIPTRLQTEDTVLTVGGLALTMRQSFILFLGGCLALICWHALDPLFLRWGGIGFVLHLVLTALPIVLALLLAMTRLHGRSLERWAIILWRYGQLPKAVIWRSTRFGAAETLQGDVR
jgi:hypothetical protein